MGWGDWLIILKTFAFISIFCGIIVLISFAVYECCQKRGYRIIQTGLILMSKFPAVFVSIPCIDGTNFEKL